MKKIDLNTLDEAGVYEAFGVDGHEADALSDNYTYANTCSANPR